MTKIEVEGAVHAERIRGALVEYGEKALKMFLRRKQTWAVYTPAVPDSVREILVDRALYRGALVGPTDETSVDPILEMTGDLSVPMDFEDLF